MRSLRLLVPILGMLVVTVAGVRPAFLQGAPAGQRPDPSIEGTKDPFKGITTEGKIRE